MANGRQNCELGEIYLLNSTNFFSSLLEYPSSGPGYLSWVGSYLDLPGPAIPGMSKTLAKMSLYPFLLTPPRMYFHCTILGF